MEMKGLEIDLFSIFIVRRRDAYVVHCVTVRGFVEGGRIGK